MTGSSKGKQHKRSAGSSRLRHVQQVPDSDTMVPETQLKANDSHYGSELEQDDFPDLDAQVILRHNTVKTLQLSPLLPTEFGVVKPRFAPTEPAFSFASAKRPTPGVPPNQDAPARQLVSHPDTAIPSIEPAEQGACEQCTDTSTGFVLKLIVL